MIVATKQACQGEYTMMVATKQACQGEHAPIQHDRLQKKLVTTRGNGTASAPSCSYPTCTIYSVTVPERTD